MPRTNNDAWDGNQRRSNGDDGGAARAVATRAGQPATDPSAEPSEPGLTFTRWAAGNIKATDVDDPDAHVDCSDGRPVGARRTSMRSSR